MCPPTKYIPSNSRSCLVDQWRGVSSSISSVARLCDRSVNLGILCRRSDDHRLTSSCPLSRDDTDSAYDTSMLAPCINVFDASCIVLAALWMPFLYCLQHGSLRGLNRLQPFFQLVLGESGSFGQ